MSLPCNFSVDLDFLQDAMKGPISTLLSFKSFIGTPAGLVAIQGALTGIITTIQGGLAGLLPAIPFASEFTSLRDTLGDLSGLAGGLVGDLTGQLTGAVSGLLGEFGGILDIDANINLSDLASSAISLGLNFDPCSLASSIPNIIKDPAGNLFEGPSLPMFIGKTDFGLPDLPELTTQVFADTLGAVNSLNTSFATISNVTDGISALKNNVTGSITGMGNALRKLPSGETIFQTQEAFITDLKLRTSKLNESNFPTIFASKEEEDAHNQSVADILIRNRLRAGDNIGVPVELL
jgi:hypothetical protein